MSEIKYCALIPTYQNGKTVPDVVRRTMEVCPDIIVVDDGSTDGTAELLFGLPVTFLSHKVNRGKGCALITGFRAAVELGFTHVITLDADGQHFPEDIPLLIEASKADTDSIIVGCRNLTSDNMPRQNTFANRFSNFWFRLQTGQKLADTQSGFRVYPLKSLHGTGLVTSRYEAELELMVFAAWNGIAMKGVPVRVWYAPEGERVSHFRPFMDFFRISVLNTILCFGAVLYALPKLLIRKALPGR